MDATGPYRHILAKTGDGVAHILLNRPDQLNPIGRGPGSMRDEIELALRGADGDSAVGAVVISGAGRAFSAGADLAAALPNRTPLEAHRFGEELLRFNAAVRAVHKPVIAAVHGLCIGAGLSLIAQCDFVVAAQDARFGLVEGRIGLPGAAELVALVGPAWAKFLIFTGEFIGASLAERIGLVLSVEPAEQLLERCLALAARIARMPRDAVALNKAAVDNVAEAMGRGAGRIAGRASETLTLAMSGRALAPDGRPFDDILRAEGIEGMKRARDSQFVGGWLRRTQGERP